jgi:hypothetical protein
MITIYFVMAVHFVILVLMMGTWGGNNENILMLFSSKERSEIFFFFSQRLPTSQNTATSPTSPILALGRAKVYTQATILGV